MCYMHALYREKTRHQSVTNKYTEVLYVHIRCDVCCYSELDAPNAPQWTVRVTMSPQIQCLLGE